MPTCAHCDAAVARNYETHGDERFPPVACSTCGKPTSSGACILHQVCPACAARDGVCEACGKPLKPAG